MTQSICQVKLKYEAIDDKKLGVVLEPKFSSVQPDIKIL